MAPRKILATFGPKRGGVRVLREADRVLVQTQSNPRRYKVFPKGRTGEQAAKVYAEAYWAASQRPEQLPPVTVRDLWMAYTESSAYRELRPRTQASYAERFRWWEDFLGKDAPAESVTMAQIETFRREQERVRAINQVKAIWRVAKIVWNWGEEQERIAVNRLRRTTFKLGKDREPLKPASYTEDEWRKILATLNPQHGRQWRAWVAITVLGWQGVRENALLNLQWRDVDLNGGWVRWRKAHDKTGRDWRQPLLPEAKEALTVAARWQGRDGDRSGYVFYAARKDAGTPHYTAQSLAYALWKAEERAGVPHKRYRGAHGFRRLVVNRGVRKGMSLEQVGAFVNQADVSETRGYVRVSDGDRERTAAVMAGEA